MERVANRSERRAGRSLARRVLRRCQEDPECVDGEAPAGLVCPEGRYWLAEKQVRLVIDDLDNDRVGRYRVAAKPRENVLQAIFDSRSDAGSRQRTMSCPEFRSREAE